MYIKEVFAQFLIGKGPIFDPRFDLGKPLARLSLARFLKPHDLGCVILLNFESI